MGRSRRGRGLNNGAVESKIGHLMGQLRTLRAQLEMLRCLILNPHIVHLALAHT